MYSFLMLRFQTKSKPLRRPQSLAAMEWLWPILLEKLPIQEPLLALIIPPALAML